MNYLNAMLEKVDEEKYDSVTEIFQSIDFKSYRNQYHFSHIKQIIQETDVSNVEDIHQDVLYPLYVEIESLLVSLRSTVDILMHLVNEVFSLNLKDVYIHNVFKHSRLPSPIKNVLKKYTRSFDNQTWNFIYNARNDVVHEKSVPQVLPINIDPFQFAQLIAFIKWEGVDREVITFFNQCLKFLQNFSNQLFESILISL